MSIYKPESNVAHGALAFSYDDQAELTTSIIDTASALDNTPFATPDLHEVELKGIPLLTSRLSAMSISTSERSNGVNTARIDINDPHSDQSRSYQMSPTMQDVWSVRRPASDEVVKYVDHGDIIQFLSIHLGEIALLKQLLDIPRVDGITLARTLSRNLPKQPKNKATKTHYSLDTDQTHTRLQKSSRNNLSRYAFFTSSVYEIGDASATKTYWYDINTKKRRNLTELTKTHGRVFITSDDGLSTAQLEDFVKIDQIRNHPQEVLQQRVGEFTSYAHGIDVA